MSPAAIPYRLVADELQAHFASATIGWQIIVLEQAGSTNDAILQLASPQGEAVSSAPSPTREGLVLFAEHQTAGRCQRGNRWESAAGEGLWVSILMRTGIPLK